LIELVPLAVVTYRPREFIEVGRGRIIGEIETVRVEGERLRGSLKGAAAADWITVSRDRVINIDVRYLLQTDDGALIYVRYEGRSDGTEGLGARPMYAAPLFETADERYRWLNSILAVGKAEFQGPDVVYEWYEVR
jgi:hypothetical protein